MIYGKTCVLKKLEAFQYQDLQVLPALDEIRVVADKVTLVIYEPYQGGLHPDGIAAGGRCPGL
ncbi:MAG: hypothetical protein AB1815_01205 [Bacillota bacterium]